MYGTDLPGRATEDSDSVAYPPPVVSVRLGEIKAFRVIDDEDEPILVISDGETSVEFGCGLAGLCGSSALGAHRLAEAVREYASAIEANLVR